MSHSNWCWSLFLHIKIAHDALLSKRAYTVLGPYGTVIEGEYDEVSAAIKASMQAVHDADAPRISMTIKMGSRLDKEQTAADKFSQAIENLP